jgi:hypothetical protein
MAAANIRISHGENENVIISLNEMAWRSINIGVAKWRRGEMAKRIGVISIGNINENKSSVAAYQ